MVYIDFESGSIKGHEDLELQLVELLSYVEEHCDGIVAEGQELVKKDFEVSNVDRIPLFAEILTQVLEDGSDDPRARAAAYYAIQFAYLVADSVIDGEVDIPLKPYFQRVLEEVPDGERSDAIKRDVARYLQHRPVIDGLISRYMPEIDQSGRYPHLAETLAGLVFMAMDYDLLQRFTNSQVDAVKDGDFEEFLKSLPSAE